MGRNNSRFLVTTKDGQRRMARTRKQKRALGIPIKPKKKRKRKKQSPPPPEKTFPYDEYLQSEWWKWRRKNALKRAKGCCERCQSTTALQVHHKTYKTLGRERDKDLECVCRKCHEREHECWIAANSHLDSISRARD